MASFRLPQRGYDREVTPIDTDTNESRGLGPVGRVAYKLLSTGAGALGGVVAGVLFKRVWALVSDEPRPPSATQPDRSWREVLAAATAQGAVFGLVKAAVDRGGAVVFRNATGKWPVQKAKAA